MRQPRYRAARKKAMYAEGIIPSRRLEVWVVKVARIEILPAWLKQRVIPGLKPSAPNQFWLRHLDAAALASFCETVRVAYSLVKTEFKRCELCERPMVGSEAEAYRAQIDSCAKGREKPCGRNCEKDQKTRLWMILRKLAA